MHSPSASSYKLCTTRKRVSNSITSENPEIITFCVRYYSRGEMYIGHGRLCVCLRVCLSLAALLRTLQSVQNATARLISGTRRRDQITPVLRELHWSCYPSESASSSKWHAWFASRCLDRRLSTWQMTAVLFLTARNAHCGQRTFRLA